MTFSRAHVIAVLVLILLFGTLLVSSFEIRGKLMNPHGLTVWVFAVGQGDAIFIDGPERQVLIDGGPDQSVLPKLSRAMFPTDRYIDDIILTHPHADHLVGILPVLERYEVGQVFDSGQGYGTADFFRFHELAPNVQPIVAGQVIDLGDGATLEIVFPKTSYEGEKLDDPNDGSVMALLTYGETTMFFTGDAGVAEEAELTLPHVDVLKVGHHGSRTSTSPEFLSMITPDAAVVSVAAENDYGLPDEDVIDRLMHVVSALYLTSMHGDIRVTSDGGEPKIRLFHL